MIDKLRTLEAEGRPIRVALVGAGAMGFGIAWQIGHTPGMRLVAVTDIKPEAAEKAAAASGQPWQRMTAGQAVPAAGPDTVWVTTDPFYVLDDAAGLDFDVLVEATNTVGFAADLCLAAIARGAHVVLMNAEVDLALGPLLHHRAQEAGVIVTSDAGDQHGVLMTMIEEIELWAFRIVMAGNIKGFLRRDATAESLAHEAAIRNLDPVMCCAYTDGSKLNVEMALVANATGLVPYVAGMEGPPAADVREVLGLFDWSRYDSSAGRGHGGGGLHPGRRAGRRGIRGGLLRRRGSNAAPELLQAGRRPLLPLLPPLPPLPPGDDAGHRPRRALRRGGAGAQAGPGGRRVCLRQAGSGSGRRGAPQHRRRYLLRPGGPLRRGRMRWAACPSCCLRATTAPTHA